MSLSRRLASKSSVIFAARLFGAGLIFVAQALIARLWGADLLGEFLIVIASVNLLSVVMPLGFQTVGSYFAAEYRARGDRRQLAAFLARAYLHIVLAFALVVVYGPSLLQLFGQAQGAVDRHFVPIALLAFGTAIVYVNSGLLVGLKRPIAGFMVDTLLRPMLVLATFLAVMSMSVAEAGFIAMLWWFAIGYVAMAAIQLVYVLVSVPKIADNEPDRPIESGRWWRFAMPWMLISLATDFFFDIDLLLLSHMLSREDLAIFGVCVRVFSLASFGVAAIYAVSLPDIFESEASADRLGFHRKVGEANMVASLIALCLFLILLVLSPFALQLFGPAFTAGAIPLGILCLGLIVRSVFGPASLVLSIHDRPWASLPAIALGLFCLVVANYVLVPPFGLMGAAFAALFAITLWSFALWLTAWRMAGVDVSILQWFRTRRLATA